jgi:hypothetical protein
MAKSKVKAISEVQRPNLISKNEFTTNNSYDIGSKDTISPIGREDQGTKIDMNQRIKLLTKNIYTAGSEYTVTD